MDVQLCIIVRVASPTIFSKYLCLLIARISLELMEQWVTDKNRFYLRNVIGTKNMVEVATALGVEKFVFTSSATIFDYQPGKTFDETAPITQTKYTEYERTKRVRRKQERKT